MSQDSVSSFVENILIILSNLPIGLRNIVIKSRLNEFKDFNQSEKKEIINNILKNYGRIERSKILNLFETWLNCLSEMDNISINSIFNSYLFELYLNPNELKDFDNSFILSLVKLLNDLPQNKREKLWNCFMESILNTPDPKKFINLLPNLNK
ncbi:MAG: hypothetical protein M3Z01_00720 [Thermoproteota archaeon]|nr:hypothetical protein [Thermoproteota archaeon]